MPRKTHPPIVVSCVVSISRPFRLLKSGGRATSAISARAAQLPRQTWTPLLKARWGLTSRWMLNFSASAQMDSSRLAESTQMPSFAPAGRGVPARTVSRVTWREYMPMGAIHRMVSSKTVAHRAGLAMAAARCSGCSNIARAATPRASRGSLSPPPIVILMFARICSIGILSPGIESGPERRESSRWVRWWSSISSRARSTSLKDRSAFAHTTGSSE